MSRKANNTFRIWNEAGYMLSSITVRTMSKETMEMVVHIKPKQDENIDFFKDRIIMRDLARRQDLYAIPYTDINEDGNAEVLLVNRDLIYKREKQMKALVEEYRASYWYIQRDESFVRNVEELNKVRSRLIAFQKEYKRMMGEHDGHITQTMIRNKDTKKTYEWFKEEFKELTKRMKDCKKCPKHLFQKQEHYQRIGDF